MGFWSRIFGAGSAVTKSSTSNPAPWFIEWLQGNSGPTLAGVEVTPETAMRLSSVFTCVRMRSEDIGKLPLYLYQYMPDGGKRRAYEHPLLSLIRDEPNPYQTALEFRQLLQAWCDLRGNGYALKETDSRGTIRALWPINPKYVQVMYVPGTYETFYRVTIPNQQIITYPSEAIFHLRGFSMDGLTGLSPIAYHRETIGLGIAAEKYGAALFGNSAQPEGAIKVPTVLSPDSAKLLRAQWEDRHRGVDNAKRIAIFDGGMEWQQTGMSNVDAQYLDVRRFTNEQIYAIYRIPAHKAGDLTRATNNNIEQMALEYVSDCLMTELVRWEQCLKRDLLTTEEKAPGERGGYFFEFVPDALLRGDTASRYAAYAIARNWGILSVNEIREKENLNHIPEGNIYLQPLNMVPAGTPPAPPPVATPNPNAGGETMPSAGKLLLGVMEAQRAIEFERKAPVVNFGQPNIQVDVAAPQMKVPDVHVDVNVPEMRMPDINIDVAAPQIKVPDVHVDVAAPQVRVPDVHVEVQAPPVPDVHVDVNVPKQPVVVNVDAPKIEVAAPVVHVAAAKAPNVKVENKIQPPPKKRTKTRVTKHDEKGRIKEFEQEEIE